MIQAVDLWNTHNQDHNDRGTRTFKVWVSSIPVTPDLDLSSSFGTEVVSDTLDFYTSNPNQVQPFSFSPITGRYVTFRAVNYIHNTGNNSSGLSEIALDAFPEPSTIILACGGLASLLLLRRHLN